MSATQGKWVEAYLKAAYEVSGQQMPERINAARQAIRERTGELEGSSDHHTERHEMEAALAALTTLETEALAWQWTRT
jgi:predicted ATPase with chaperone activity